MPSSTSCSSSLWRPCSSSALCHFSATICGLWGRTGRLSVRMNRSDSTLWIQLWTLFPHSFTIDSQKPSVLLFSQTAETKAAFLWAAAGTWPRFLEIERSSGSCRFSLGEPTPNEKQMFITSIAKTETFWLFLRLCSALYLKHQIWPKEAFLSSIFWKTAIRSVANFGSICSPQSGRRTLLCHQIGAHRSRTSKQRPPAQW